MHYQSYHRGIEINYGTLHILRPDAINRTIVELKYAGTVSTESVGLSINRTIVELKY